MGHVQTTIRKLITWAQVRSGTRSGMSPSIRAGWNVLLTLVVDCPLILIFDILMKVNWQLSNKSIRWPSSPECIASSLFYSLRSSIFQAFRWYFISSRALFCILREAPLLKKYIHPRKFGQQVTVHRPPDLPSVRTTDIPMFHFTLSSKFGSLQPNCTSMFWSIDSCQNSASAD